MSTDSMVGRPARPGTRRARVCGRQPGKGKSPGLTWDDLGLSPDDLAWHADAACLGSDGDAFFPERDDPTAAANAATAKRVCQACPVRARCLDYALEHEERFGIWGGLNPNERRNLDRRTPHPKQRNRDAAIDRLTRAGRSAEQIAAALDISTRTVNRVRARHRDDTTADRQEAA